MPTLQELLHPQVIFDSITSRIKAPNDTLQRFFGIQIGGPNIMRIRGRSGAYDIFDYTREVGTASLPMTPATRISAKAIAQQPVILLRKNEAIPIYYDSLNNMRMLGKPSSTVDKGGVQYIEEQERRLKQQFAAFREFLSLSLLFNKVWFSQSGEELQPQWPSAPATPIVTVNQQIPTNNLGQLNGNTIITVPWNNNAAATIYGDVLAINQYALSQSGWPSKHIWLDETLWTSVTANTDMRARAGTSNVTFENFTGLGKAGPEDKAPDEFQAMLKPLPGIVWHIYSGALDFSGTTTKLMSTTQISVLPEPDQSWVACIQGTEFIAENETQPPVERELPYFWPWYIRDPARIELVGMDLAMPVIRVPKAVMAPTVVF